MRRGRTPTDAGHMVLLWHAGLICALGCAGPEVPGADAGFGGIFENPYNRNSGADRSRAGAEPLELETLTDDRLSESEGDHTDWKTFSLEAPLTVRLNMWWDSPEVRVEVTLLDEEGSVVAKQPHQTGERLDSFGPAELRPGLYFLRLEAKKGSSVYTMQLTEDLSDPRKRRRSGGSSAPRF